MSDDDRLLASIRNQERTLADGCTSCNRSEVYCRCVAYIEGDGARCCGSCSHEGAK